MLVSAATNTTKQASVSEETGTLRVLEKVEIFLNRKDALPELERPRIIMLT